MECVDFMLLVCSQTISNLYIVRLVSLQYFIEKKKFQILFVNVAMADEIHGATVVVHTLDDIFENNLLHFLIW